MVVNILIGGVAADSISVIELLYYYNNNNNNYYYYYYYYYIYLTVWVLIYLNWFHAVLLRQSSGREICIFFSCTTYIRSQQQNRQSLLLSAINFQQHNTNWWKRMIMLHCFIYSITWTLVRVFANGPGSIPGRVIPKTLKMELDTTLLNTQHYKVRFKGKVEQSREWSSALSYTLV